LSGWFLADHISTCQKQTIKRRHLDENQRAMVAATLDLADKSPLLLLPNLHVSSVVNDSTHSLRIAAEFIEAFYGFGGVLTRPVSSIEGWGI
jgi:hypothetical protein